MIWRSRLGCLSFAAICAVTLGVPSVVLLGGCKTPPMSEQPAPTSKLFGGAYSEPQLVRPAQVVTNGPKPAVLIEQELLWTLIY